MLSEARSVEEADKQIRNFSANERYIHVRKSYDRRPQQRVLGGGEETGRSAARWKDLSQAEERVLIELARSIVASDAPIDAAESASARYPYVYLDALVLVMGVIAIVGLVLGYVRSPIYYVMFICLSWLVVQHLSYRYFVRR